MSDWRSLRPEWGIVLGSGLGAMVERVEVIAEVPYAEVPGLPASRVPGHAGKFLFGRLKGTPVVMAQGRVHLYEGHRAADVTAGVRFLAEHGVKRLVLTNAAGTANPAFAPGAWMMLRDHLNLTGTTPLLGGAHFIDMTEVYSARLRREFAAAAQAEGVTLHEGIYAGLLGPQYETPAEVRMYRGFGADALGMSTVLEAIQARALRLEVAGFSCLTNWAAGIGTEPLHHQEVLAMGQRAAGDMVRLLERVITA